MELYYPRRRIFNTTFVTTPTGPGSSMPIYRISTTRNWTFSPHKTTIEFFGANGNPDDYRVVAQIIWNWPSRNRSYIHFGGHLYALSEFLRFGEGTLNLDSLITFENETYTWRSNRLEPQLYDSHGKQVITYKRHACIQGPNSPSPLGKLRIDGVIASNPMARDAVFTSFFIVMTTRNFYLPWKKLCGTMNAEQKKAQDTAESNPVGNGQDNGTIPTGEASCKEQHVPDVSEAKAEVQVRSDGEKN